MSGDSLEKIQQMCRPGSVLGLERLTELLRRLGDPQDKLRYVHVAGSNGKGSMCAMLSSILAGCGYKTGMYTSPQLLRLNERYRINGREIGDEALSALAESVRAVALEMEDVPTEFEITTAMMFQYFLEQQCDIVVLEVGMGGRLDATNVIPAPEVAMIGSIALEHTRELGDTIEKIAFEKAGIIKSGCAAVTYPAAPSVEAVLEEVCRQRNVPRQRARVELLQLRESSLERQRFGWGDYLSLTLTMAGVHQRWNAVMVLECVEQLRRRGWNLPRERVESALAAVRWPARLEVLRRKPLFLLDGAHNPQCMEVLAENLTGFLAGEKAVFLMGVMADKEYDKMIALLRPFAKSFVCVTPKNDRALPAETFAAWLRELGCPAEACPTVPDGVRRAAELAGGGPVVACGSLYMAGEIRQTAETLFGKGAETMEVDKKKVRSGIAAARRALPEEERTRLGAIISRRLMEHPAVQKAQVIMSYVAFAGEVDLTEFHRWAKEQGKTVAFPITYGQGRMEAFVPESDEAWVVGQYGITSPDESRSKKLSPEDFDLVIAPCVGFDESRMRLGWGGGYYDRYLPKCPKATAIAAAYELQKLNPVPDVQHWDVAMDAVATEERWY